MSHRCRIDTTTEDPFYPGRPGYVVVCDECGPIRVYEEPLEARRRCTRHEHADPFAPTPYERPRCPYCGRVMSDREHAEQGACNDCHGGAYSPG